MKCIAALFCGDNEVSYPGYSRQPLEVRVAVYEPIRLAGEARFTVPDGGASFTHARIFTESGVDVLETRRYDPPCILDARDTVVLR